MAKKKVAGKYDKYFLTDVIHGTMKPEWGGEVISAGAGHEDIIPANARALPAITAIRKPYMFHDPVHKHMFTEFFFIFGSKPMNMKEFDADVEFTFGPEMEKHTIKSPTIVVAAPGVYHCPLNYARTGKPIYCLEAFMTTGYSGVNYGEDLKEIRVTEPDYNRYFTDGVVRSNKWGGEGLGLSAVPEYIIPAGARISIGITAVRKPYTYYGQTHKHNFTEYYYFFGSNPMDMKEFDAEVEFSFGEEQEKHLINGPTVVVVPPGIYHCPLDYTKVDKPIYVMESAITSKYKVDPLMPAPAAAKPAKRKK
jgi:hypothetical protein